MKAREDIKTVTFEAEYGFMVDIVDTKFWTNHEPVWDVYLYRDCIGEKMYMFGLPKAQNPILESVIPIVEANLPDYYSDYDEEYCQCDDVDRGYENNESDED